MWLCWLPATPTNQDRDAFPRFLYAPFRTLDQEHVTPWGNDAQSTPAGLRFATWGFTPYPYALASRPSRAHPNEPPRALPRVSLATPHPRPQAPPAASTRLFAIYEHTSGSPHHLYGRISPIMEPFRIVPQDVQPHAPRHELPPEHGFEDFAGIENNE